MFLLSTGLGGRDRVGGSDHHNMELPLVVVVSVSVCATLLILLNVVLLSYCALSRRKHLKAKATGAFCVLDYTSSRCAR